MPNSRFPDLQVDPLIWNAGNQGMHRFPDPLIS